MKIISNIHVEEVKRINDLLCGLDSDIYEKYSEFREKYRKELIKVYNDTYKDKDEKPRILGPFSLENLNIAPKKLLKNLYKDQLKIIKEYNINI